MVRHLHRHDHEVHLVAGRQFGGRTEGTAHTVLVSGALRRLLRTRTQGPQLESPDGTQGGEVRAFGPAPVRPESYDSHADGPAGAGQVGKR